MGETLTCVGGVLHGRKYAVRMKRLTVPILLDCGGVGTHVYERRPDRLRFVVQIPCSKHPAATWKGGR